jgi:signal transduction histidine kinase
VTTRSKICLGAGLLIIGAQAAVTYGISRTAILHLPFHLSISGAYFQTTYGDLSQCAIVLFAAIIMVMNALRSRGPVRIFWTLMAIGLGFWIADLGLWAYYEVFTRTDVPQITIGDTFLFLHLMPMVAALGAHPETPAQAIGRQRTWLDFALLLTYWLYMYALLVMPFHYVTPDLPSYNFNFDTVDKTGHWILVIATAVAFIRTRGPWRRLYLVLTIACISYALFSDIANLAIDLNAYYTGSAFDIVLVGTMALFAYVALEGRWMSTDISELSPPAVEANPRKLSLRWPAILGTVATLSTPAIGIYVLEYAPHMAPQVREFRLVVTLLAMVMLIFLLFLKQNLLQADLVNSLTSVSEAFSDLKQVKNQLVQSEKLASMGRLLAGAAHEINNPLTAILGYSDLIKSDHGVDSQARSMAEKIGQQARRTKMLVENLLMFSQEVPTRRSANDVQVLVNNAIKLANLEAGNAVKVEVSGRENLPPVIVDSGQILQVFVHLIRNAADAMRESPVRVLHIATRAGNSQVQVEFADSGAGVKDPDLVFDPFYTTKSPGKGTGLGLSACYGIIQKHGGQITCQNRPQGGAVFTVILPTAPQTELQNA